MKMFKNFMQKNHPFHLTSESPWPLIISFNIMNLLLINIISFNLKFSNWVIFMMITLMLSSYQWWRDLIRESTYQGFHTINIVNMIKFSMILFIISEMFFFISFFWTFIHSSISSSMEIGNIWPPKFIMLFNPYDIPLLNSIILISSGLTITWSHHLLKNNYKKSLKLLIITIMLGLYFSMIQYIEYNDSSFTFNDSIFGSIFFLTTGFHGIHVIIGSLFLMISAMRMKKNQFSMIHHLNFELASWYWHFVDVIWLIVYMMIYWWMY